MDFEYKRLTNELLKDLHLLFKQSGKKVTFKQLVKKYGTERFGAQNIGYIAYDKNKSVPVGFYGVLPVIASYQGKEVLIAQSADTITHPDYRKLGLFKNLAEKTYDLCAKNSIDFLFGVPNFNSYPGFIKHLGWQDIGRFIIFTRKVHTFPIGFLVNKLNFLRSFYSLYVRVILLILAKRVSFHKLNKNPDIKFHIPWTTIYKDYKLNHSQFEVTINNVNLVLSFKGALKIGKYDAATNDLSGIHRKLKLVAFFTGCHKIVFQQLDCITNSNVEYNFSTFSKREGLPFIQKRINETSIGNEILAINYLDFDTF
jgi:hypothetical protein